MNLHNLRTVACYNSKLLLRSWLFRFFFFLMFCIIIVYHVVSQSDLFPPFNSGLITLSSFIPFMNAYWFTILQTIPLCFLAGMFLVKEKKIDSMDAIYYRPESNAEYVLGILWGIIPVFMCMAAISMCFGLVIHLFASKAPFDFWLYLFYWVTLVFPALVFMAGFSFFIHCWVRNRAFSILILLIFTALIVFGMDDFQHGLFDPLGVTLPGAFSKVTGHPDMTGYLLQRCCWLLLGFGFMGLAILFFKRLSNHPINRVRVMGSVMALMAVGVLFGIFAYLRQAEKDYRRGIYAETYDEYADVPKGSIVRQDIDVRQEGTRLVAESRFVLRNSTSEALSEVILYLNPKLDIVSVQDQEGNLTFEREHQVIRVRKDVSPGQEVELRIRYEGGIDPQICYLDVPDPVLYSTAFHRYSSCRYGKDFVLLRDDYTLLIPECLWYPVALPPVNPKVSYDIPKDFTMYTLHVSGVGDKKVISQGKREETGDEVTYRGEYPLHGISLCMGEFDRRAITVDSTTYELYLFKGHDKLLYGLDILRDTLPSLLRDTKEQLEFEMGRSYPYSQFILAEVPISFVSFYRNERGSSECVQPGLVFVPERGMGYWRDVMEAVKYKGVPAEFRDRVMQEPLEARCAQMVGSFFRSFLTGDRKYDFGSMDILRGFFPVLSRNFSFSDVDQINSPYNVSSMFLNYTVSFRSRDYPVMGAVLNSMLRKQFRRFQHEVDKKVVNYFDGHSLKDAFYDRSLKAAFFTDLLEVKSEEMLRLLSINGGTINEMLDFIRGYVNEHDFKQVDFNDFNQKFNERFGQNWVDYIPDWYTRDQLPTFWVDDFKVEVIGEGPMDGVSIEKLLANRKEGETLVIPGMTPSPVCVKVKVFNNSNVEGMVSIVFEEVSHELTGKTWNRIMSSYSIKSYLIPANSGKEIVTVSDNAPSSTVLATNLSRHLPNIVVGRGMFEKKFTRDTVRRVLNIDKSSFLPGEGEIIVDNEDDGFKLSGGSDKSFVRTLFNKAVKDKYYEGSRMVSVKQGSKVEPGLYIENMAYGLGIRSAAFMDEGSGARMEWQTRIDREGEYDVYVYVPSPVHVYREKRENKGGGRGFGMSVSSSFSVSFGGSGNGPEIKQYYTVTNAGKEYEVVGNVATPGEWVLLGTYRFSPGECKVTLSDRGESEQLLFGDAVKWVYVGKK